MEDDGEVVGGGGDLMSSMMSKKGEVDYKTKSGTAWSHSFLNQKPWHPLSYPNQRRKWIAEQTDAQRARRAQEVAREFAQEQDFFRQTALISKKEKEKVETMKAVSFMYVRPPGYNAESAKAAELEDERRRVEQNNPHEHSAANPTSMIPESAMPGNESQNVEKKKPRPRDVFGRTLPTEEEFQVLKNAPRLETGMPARSKPFGVEVRNVKCARCGNFGHQSGDRECPLKDVIMPNEENRLKRDDPLTAILAHTDVNEPLKWELKQKPGISPPRGGFKPDDPNQQIVAEDIFDEYGGFLSGGIIPELLTNFSVGKTKKHSKSKSKHKSRSSADSESKVRHKNRSLSPSDSEPYIEKSSKKKRLKEKKHKKTTRQISSSSSSDDADFSRHPKRAKPSLSEDSDSSLHHRNHKRTKPILADDSDSSRHDSCYKRTKPRLSDDSDSDKHHRHHRRTNPQYRVPNQLDDSDSGRHYKRTKPRLSDDSDSSRHHSYYKRTKPRLSDDSDPDKHHWHHRRTNPQYRVPNQSDDSDSGRHYKRTKPRLSNDSDSDRHRRHHRRSKSQYPVPSSSDDSDALLRRQKRSKHRHHHHYRD